MVASRYRPGDDRFAHRREGAVVWASPHEAQSTSLTSAPAPALSPVSFASGCPARWLPPSPTPASRAVLVRRVPDVLAVGARAEALPFVDATFDAVAVSSAWHWMDLALTVPEAARVLRPGGRLGVLWNGPAHDVEWVAELLGPRRERVGPANDHAKRHRVELPPDAPFTTPETTVITWSMPMTRDELVGLAGTYERGDHASGRGAGGDPPPGGATGYRPRGLRKRDDSPAAHEMPVLAGYPQLTGRCVGRSAAATTEDGRNSCPHR